jgi:hypothetical protein
MLHDGDVLKNLLMPMLISDNGGSSRRLPRSPGCNIPMLKPSMAEGKRIGMLGGKNQSEPKGCHSL